MPVIIFIIITNIFLVQHVYFRRRLRQKDQEIARQKELVKFSEQRLTDSAETWRLFACEERNADANKG